MNVQERLLQERVDPYLTDRALTHLARQAVSGVGSVHGYSVLTGGCWNRVIEVQYGAQPLVFKISPHNNDKKLQREYAVLRCFAESTELHVPVPYLLAAEEPVPGTVLVMSRIPGAVMQEVYGLLNYGQRRRITDQIANDLAELHTLRAPGFGGVEYAESERHSSWPEFWLPRYRTALEEAGASGSVPAAILDGARALEPGFREPLEIGPTGTCTHYDIWSGNVMIDLGGDSPRVSGYIDIPGFYADYARELSFAMLFGVANRRFFEQYTRAHELDDGFELRANIYNLKMNIKHIQMYPSQRVYQEGAIANIRFLQEALA